MPGGEEPQRVLALFLHPYPKMSTGPASRSHPSFKPGLATEELGPEGPRMSSKDDGLCGSCAVGELLLLFGCSILS